MKILRHLCLLALVAFLLTLGGNSVSAKSEEKTTRGKKVKNEQQFKNRQFSDEQKKELRSRVMKLLDEAEILIEKENYSEAYKLLNQANRMIGKLGGIEPRKNGNALDKRRGPFNENSMKPPFGQNYYPGMSNDERGKSEKKQKNNPIKEFMALREKGEEGWEKACSIFEKQISKMKEKNIKFDETALEQYKKAVKTHDEGKTAEAFDILFGACKTIAKSMPRHGKGKQPGEKAKTGIRQAPGEKMDLSKLNISPDERAKLKSSLKALQENARIYVEKFGKDDFILDCFGKYKAVERGLRKGEISIEKAMKSFDEISKKITSKL